VVVLTTTSFTSCGSILFSAITSSAAVIGWWVSASVGNALYPHSVIMNFSPRPESIFSASQVTFPITSNTPSFPSNSCSGLGGHGIGGVLHVGQVPGDDSPEGEVARPAYPYGGDELILA